LFCAISLLLVLWLSFFLEPIQSKYGHLVIIVLFATLSFIIFTNRAIAKAAFSEKTDIFLWAYILMVTIGVFFAQNRQIAVNQYINYAIPIPVTYYLFKNGFPLVKRKDRFFLIISYAAGLVALYAVLEYVFQRNPLYEYFVTNIYYKYYLFVKHRPMATQFVPQVLGTYLATCAPAAYYFVSKSGNMRGRIFWVAWSILIFIGVIVAQRGAVVCLTASSLFYFGMKNRKVLLAFCMLIFVLLVVFYFARAGSLRQLGIGGFSEKDIYKNRIKRTITAVKMVKDYPVLGFGLYHYKLFFDKYDKSRLAYLLKTPENMFLMIACETGLFSLVFFILFLALLLKKSFIHVKLKLANHEIALVLLSGFMSILVSMVEYDALYWTVPFYFFWIYCGILSSVCISN